MCHAKLGWHIYQSSCTIARYRFTIKTGIEGGDGKGEVVVLLKLSGPFRLSLWRGLI